MPVVRRITPNRILSESCFFCTSKKKSHLSFPAEPKPHLKAGPISGMQSGVQKLPVTDRDDHGHLKFTPSKTDLSVKTPACCLQVQYIMDILRLARTTSFFHNEMFDRLKLRPADFFRHNAIYYLIY